MRITSKGQVTIPIEIRERIGLLPGTEVEFKIVRGTVYLRKTGPRSKRSRELIARMRGKGNQKLTTDRILAMTRG